MCVSALITWKQRFLDWKFRIGFFLSEEYAFKDVIRQQSYSFHEYVQKLHGVLKVLEKTVNRGLFFSIDEFSKSFPQYVKALFSLHAVNLLCWQEVTYDCNIITEFVREVSWQSKVLKSRHHNFPKPIGTSLDRSFVLFLTSQCLMENLTGTISPLEFKLASKCLNVFLEKSLECQDSKSKTIANASLAYMAALHFAESEYQIAIDLCSTLILNETTEEEEKETLNAGCLLYIEDIASNHWILSSFQAD